MDPSHALYSLGCQRALSGQLGRRQVSQTLVASGQGFCPSLLSLLRSPWCMHSARAEDQHLCPWPGRVGVGPEHPDCILSSTRPPWPSLVECLPEAQVVWRSFSLSAGPEASPQGQLWQQWAFCREQGRVRRSCSVLPLPLPALSPCLLFLRCASLGAGAGLPACLPACLSSVVAWSFPTNPHASAGCYPNRGCRLTKPIIC